MRLLQSENEPLRVPLSEAVPGTAQTHAVKAEGGLTARAQAPASSGLSSEELQGRWRARPLVRHLARPSRRPNSQGAGQVLGLEAAGRRRVVRTHRRTQIFARRLATHSGAGSTSRGAHTPVLMRTVEKSAPTASPEYADVAQRMTLARVVKVLPQRMRALALARQRLPAPAPDAPRTYPWSSVQPFAAPACAVQPPRRCIQARRAKQPHMSRAQTHERDGTRTP